MNCFGEERVRRRNQRRKSRAIDGLIKHDKKVYNSTARLLLFGKWWIA
jgi:hypothetical protein